MSYTKENKTVGPGHEWTRQDEEEAWEVERADEQADEVLAFEPVESVVAKVSRIDLAVIVAAAAAVIFSISGWVTVAVVFIAAGLALATLARV
jgi:hypothetical protein